MLHIPQCCYRIVICAHSPINVTHQTSERPFCSDAGGIEVPTAQILSALPPPFRVDGVYKCSARKPRDFLIHKVVLYECHRCFCFPNFHRSNLGQSYILYLWIKVYLPLVQPSCSLPFWYFLSFRLKRCPAFFLVLIVLCRTWRGSLLGWTWTPSCQNSIAISRELMSLMMFPCAKGGFENRSRKGNG